MVLGSWAIDPATDRLTIEATLTVADDARKVTMTYPFIFPSAPPSIRAHDLRKRWGGHHYVGNGELCLEIRPDNWRSSDTGADMLRSALKLLASVVDPDDDAEPVADAHHTTLGQDLRTSHYRFVLTSELQAKLVGLISPRPVKVSGILVNDCLLMWVYQLTEEDGSIWTDPSAPASLDEFAFYRGWAVHIPDDDFLRTSAAIDAAIALKDGSFWGMFVKGEPPPANGCLFVSSSTGVRAFRMSGSDPREVYEYRAVPQDTAVRTPARNEALKDKLFAILGCGSLGSKVATSLARGGARNFLLVDDDVLLLGNLVRNELDVIGVGAHKVDALAAKLKSVAAGVTVTCRRHHLGGQEANSSLATLLEALAGADLIVDTTVDDDAFNYAASAAVSARRTMCWARVFAGGYGGMIARSRPGIDPTPTDARALIEQWCSNKPNPPTATRDYGGMRTDGGPPMVADDADVGAIATALARMIIDVAIQPGDPDHPFSAYMIGLRREWIFNGPFDTWPIDLGRPLPEPEVRVVEDLRKLGMNLLEARSKTEAASDD